MTGLEIIIAVVVATIVFVGLWIHTDMTTDEVRKELSDAIESSEKWRAEVIGNPMRSMRWWWQSIAEEEQAPILDRLEALEKYLNIKYVKTENEGYVANKPANKKTK